MPFVFVPNAHQCHSGVLLFHTKQPSVCTGQPGVCGADVTASVPVCEPLRPVLVVWSPFDHHCVGGECVKE